MSDCPEASYAATFLTLEKDPTRPSQTRVQTEITLASIQPGLLALYQPSHQVRLRFAHPVAEHCGAGGPGWGAASGH